MLAIFLIFIINILSFLLYNNDKHRAIYGKWRIPEAVLVIVSFFGGAFGAFLAMKMFRHKTDKKLFRVSIPIFLGIQIVVFALMGYVLNTLPDMSF